MIGISIQMVVVIGALMFMAGTLIRIMRILEQIRDDARRTGP